MFDQIQTFPCLRCREIISDQAEVCRYCGIQVDKGSAQIAAHNQSRVNQACSDASYLKIAAFCMWNFLALTLVPFMPLVNWGFLITFVAVIVMIVRWQLRFRDIKTGDPDYAKAIRNKNLSFVLWLLALLVAFFIIPLLPLEGAELY
ncbi:MAG: hypothetical protein H0T45_06595 [Pyrinomonadaceae bacterium]|nr:hypothetical protein [Pyrinomonadaceae bacterium]